jgi:hypothetical protein
MTKTATFSCVAKDLHFDILYEYEPYVPGTRYKKNGDPGDAPEGGTIEDVKVFLWTKDEKLDVTEALELIGAIDFFYDRAYEDMEGAGR